MQLLKQSTEVDVRIGPFVDDGDGLTPVATVLANCDQAELLKHDGAATATLVGATFAAVTDCAGWYDLTLTVSHTDTLGLLEVVIQDADVHCPVFARFMVVTANVWDSIFSTDYLQVDAVQVEGSDATDTITGAVPTAAAIRTEIDSNSTQLAAIVDDTDLIDDATSGLAKIASDVAAILVDTNELQTDDVPGLISAHDAKLDTVDGIVDAILADTNELQTDDVPGLISAHDAKLDTVDGIVDAILLDTAEIGAAGVGLTDLGGMSTAMKAEVNAEVDGAIEDYHLDQLFAADYDPASKPGVATALLNELVENDGGVSRFTQNALEQGPSGEGSTTYMVWGDAVQDDDNYIYWAAQCLKNGQPENSTNATPTLYLLNGDGTRTLAATGDTVANDDDGYWMNGKFQVELTEAREYALVVSLTADSGTRVGTIPLKIPPRTS